MLALAATTWARGGENEGAPSLVVEGLVLAPGGDPAPDAVVVSSAGGKTVTDAAGHYRLELARPARAASLQVTAVSPTSSIASASVALATGSGSIRVDPLTLASGSACPAAWLPTFGAFPGTDDAVFALATFDDGSGPALYVGGDFTLAGGVAAEHIARFDGSSWSAVGGGTDESVRSLLVFDDGSGPALYAGGVFTHAGGLPANRIARWNGTSWSALGSGRPNPIHALAVYDDGGGPALYAGGGFALIGGVSKWTGTSWQATGSQMNDEVLALAVFDDGSGPELYAGGFFSTAGGQNASRIARYDGSSWSPLGSGVTGTFAVVYSLAVFDDGSGLALHVGGTFSQAGGLPVNSLAKWNGASWSPLAAGLIGSATIFALRVFDDGGGAALYAGVNIGGAGLLERWDGSTWTAAPQLNSSVTSLAAFDDGSGPALWAGGQFDLAVAGVAGSHLARWDGTSWTPSGPGFDRAVLALAVLDDGSGPALYAAGQFLSAGDQPAGHVARWDGTSWAPLGSGVNSVVHALAVFDDGGGPALYAAGQFSVAGGVGANNIAKWDGSSWTPLGTGLNSTVLALTVLDDGGGPALYAGGQFTAIFPTTTARHVARWNGTSWSALGNGLSSTVNVLTVFDDGSGPALYAGGSFLASGASPVNRIARWDGASWSALGTGIDAPVFQIVDALAVFDDGGGPALFAGGSFVSAGGVPASNIARWDGTSWSALGSGVDGDAPLVDALAVFDAGCGPELVVGGLFSSAGGMAVNNAARWDGTTWTPLGGGVNERIEDFLVFDDGGGPALLAAGFFDACPESGDAFLARWSPAPDTTAPVLSCPASITVLDDLANGPGEPVTFKVVASDDLDPAPIVTCTPPSGSAFPAGTTSVICTATDASGNQASCSFPVTVQPKARRR